MDVSRQLYKPEIKRQVQHDMPERQRRMVATRVGRRCKKMLGERKYQTQMAISFSTFTYWCSGMAIRVNMA
jgi:hypothetical protein